MLQRTWFLLVVDIIVTLVILWCQKQWWAIFRWGCMQVVWSLICVVSVSWSKFCLLCQPKSGACAGSLRFYFILVNKEMSGSKWHLSSEVSKINNRNMRDAIRDFQILSRKWTVFIDGGPHLCESQTQLCSVSEGSEFIIQSRCIVQDFNFHVDFFRFFCAELRSFLAFFLFQESFAFCKDFEHWWASLQINEICDARIIPSCFSNLIGSAQ